MIHLTVTLFGAFRATTHGETLSLSVPDGTNVGGLRPLLEQELQRRYPGFANQGLIADSAFADDKAVLDEAFVPADGSAIAVLPPVCGG